MITANTKLVNEYKHILINKYESPLIDMDEEFCESELGLKRATVNRKASEQGLPFATSKKVGPKSGYVVSVDALAEWMAAESIKAKHEWQSVNGVRRND